MAGNVDMVYIGGKKLDDHSNLEIGHKKLNDYPVLEVGSVYNVNTFGGDSSVVHVKGYGWYRSTWFMGRDSYREMILNKLII